DQVSGFEIIGGSEFDDTLIGDDGDNLFYSYAGDDSIDGGGGADLVLYNVTSSPITADLSTGVATGEGQDSFANIEGIVGTEFNDTLTGDANDNVLIGGPGNDHLTGGNGDDYFEGGAGDDAIDGGLGTFDMANFYFAEGLTANLQLGTATGEGDDSMVGIEALLGSNSADVLTGDGGPNYIFGSGGADEISGAAGDDELDGGPGSDSLDGGPGTDSCLSGESVTACEGQTQSAQAAQAQSQQEALSTMGGVIGGTGEKRAH
ncbi:MAG: hypothetical protein QOK47_532, partial [Actinomycetota bacterium]|nr:hypothetical protein [Actinomycetota bacterium]